jgi:rRNA maturation endonuclease Nob1
MIKLICEKCSHIWYTSNTKPNQKCNDCGGALSEIELIASKEIERSKEYVSEKKSEDKIIYINFN